MARVLISWFPNLDRTHPVFVFLYQITEPVLRPVRNLLPPASMIDFSPLIVFLLLSIVQPIVIELLVALLF
jgi:YggT family protein